MGFTGFYGVLLDITGFQWVLVSFTGFYWVLLGFTGFYLMLANVLSVFWRLLTIRENGDGSVEFSRPGKRGKISLSASSIKENRRKQTKKKKEQKRQKGRDDTKFPRTSEG